MAGLLRLLRSRWSPPALPTTSFAGKTILITGSNTGLGLHAARHYLRLSASRVILAVRSPTKGDDAARTLNREFPKLEKDSISVLPLDMNSYSSITAFVKRVDDDFKRVDVAVLNAGLINRTYVKSVEGWEETLQVNTISTALLALLLLPKLRVAKTKSPDLAHLVIVSSGTHSVTKRSSFPPTSQNILEGSSIDTGAFLGQRQYGISKLFLMYAVKALASIATSPDGSPRVLVTSCCPGFCFSDLVRQYSTWYERFFVWLFYSMFARSVEVGSRTLVSAATVGAEGQGGYWKDDHLMKWVVGFLLHIYWAESLIVVFISGY